MPDPIDSLIKSFAKFVSSSPVNDEAAGQVTETLLKSGRMMFHALSHGFVPRPVRASIQTDRGLLADSRPVVHQPPMPREGEIAVYEHQRESAKRLSQILTSSSRHLPFVGLLHCPTESVSRSKVDALIAPWIKLRFWMPSQVHYGCLMRQDRHGPHWLKGRGLGRGTFGKVYLARNANDKVPVAIKVLSTASRRLQPPEASLPRGKFRKTIGQSDARIRKTIRQTVECRKWIDEAYHQAVRGQCGLDPLHAFRAFYTSHRIFDAGVNNGKYYTVMSFEEGDLSVLSKQLPTEARGWIALGAALQVSFELNVLHEKKKAHCDIKLENMLFDKHGHIKLLDYDLIRPVNFDNNYLDRKGARGSFAVPEMFEITPDGIDLTWLTTKIDIYTLSASLLCFLAPTGRCPFYFLGGMKNQKNDSIGTPTFYANVKEIDELHSYRMDVLEEGALNLNALRRGTRFDNFFVEAYEHASPQLFNFLFVFGIAMDPENRPDAAAFYDNCLQIFFETQQTNTTKVLDLFRALAFDLENDELFADGFWSLTSSA